MNNISIIDFDEMHSWTEPLSVALEGHVSNTIKQKLKKLAPQYLEDALDAILDMVDQNRLIDDTIDWINSTNVVGYHGSRLSNAEVLSIKDNGLIPLKANSRRERIIRALSKHPDWPKIRKVVDETIRRFGAGAIAGKREGQVHLTLSKSGLVNTFNHYLIYGSEFDKHVAYELLGDEGISLLKQDGLSRLIKVKVPGVIALASAHPFSSMADMRMRGEVPNLLEQLLSSWAFKLSNDSFETKSLYLDCGMVFRESIPSSWILSIDTIPDNSVF